MKKLLLLILCAAFAASCEKEDVPENTHPIPQQILELGPDFGQPTR